MSEPVVRSCLWPASFLHFLKKTEWQGGSPKIPLAQAEDIQDDDDLVCDAPESLKGQWLIVTALHESHIDLADQHYQISAFVSEEKLKRIKSLYHACSSSDSPGLVLLVRLLKCGIGLSLSTSEREDDQRKFCLYVLDFDDRQVPGSQPWERPPITGRSTVRTLIKQACEWVSSSRSAISINHQTSAPPSSFPTPHTRVLQISNSDMITHDRKSKEGSKSQANMASTQHSTEQQRWGEYRKLGRIPKYGSCPSTTSQAQVVLLGQAQAWDPPPPGQDGPRGYIPLGDLELLTKLHEHPDAFTEGSKDSVANKKPDQSSSPQKRNVQSLPDDPVAYAQVVRRRDATPEATALGQSQWPPTPAQKRRTDADESAICNSPRSKKFVATQSCSNSDEDAEMNSDLEEPASSQLPADTDEEDSLPRAPADGDADVLERPHDNFRDTSKTSQSAMHKHSRATAEETASDGPLRQSARTESADDDMEVEIIENPVDARRTGNSLDPSEDGHARPPRKLPLIDKQGKTIRQASYATNSPARDVAESDSELEEIAPKGMGDVPSSIPSGEMQTPRTSTVQVGRTPYSGTERLETLKKKPDIKSTLSKDFAPSKSTATRRATHNVMIPKGSSVFNGDGAQQLERDSSPSHQLLMESSQAEEPDRVSLKRKITSDHQLDRKAKLFKVRADSPIFSQDIQAHVGSASAVDQLRREHFERHPRTATVTPVLQASAINKHDSPAILRQVPREIMHLSEESSSSEADEDTEELPAQRVQRSGTTLRASTSHSPSLHNRQPASATATQVFGDASGSMQGHLGSSLKMHSQNTFGYLDSQHVPEMDAEMRDLAQQPKRRWHEVISPVGPDRDTEADSQMSESSNESEKGLPTSQLSIRTEDLGEVRRSSIPTSSNLLRGMPVTISSGGLYGRFKDAYPMYTGSFNQFLAICKRIQNPKEGSSLMKAFLDDFVARFPLEYKPYYVLSLDEGESPQNYEEWFEDNVEATKFKKRVLSKDNIAVLLSNGGLNASRAMKGVIGITPVPLSRTGTRDKSVSPPIARSHHSVKSSRAHASRSLNSRRDVEATPRQAPASHTARLSNEDTTIDLTGDGAKTENQNQARLAKARGGPRRSLPWPLSSADAVLDKSEALENVAPTRQSSRQSAHSVPRPPVRLGDVVTSYTASSPAVQDKSALNGSRRARATLQGNRENLGRVASTGALPSRNRPTETNPRSRGIQSKQASGSRPDLSKKPMTAAIAEYKLPSDYRTDAYSPMRMLNKNIQSIKPSAGNAFAQEAGVKPVAKTSFKTTKVNIDAFMPKS